VTKYEQRLQEVFNFTRAEIAVLCVLLLRGPQTPGELRGRSERLHRFEALEDVQSAIQKLMQREPPLARVLARQPGTKESRYAHLLAGGLMGEEARRRLRRFRAIRRMRSALRVLKKKWRNCARELSDIKDQMERFRKQFE